MREAWRVLGADGTYFACSAARSSDPELVPEGYPASPFDADEAVEIVGRVFDDVEAEWWDRSFFTLESKEEVRAYCKSHYIPLERAKPVDAPLRLTKRRSGVRKQVAEAPDVASRWL